MWLHLTGDPLRQWEEDASELMQKETRKLSHLFINPCPSLLMVTPGTLLFWNFWSDYRCSAAQLTCDQSGLRQTARKLSSHASLSAGNFNGKPRQCEWVNGRVHHTLQINISQPEFPSLLFPLGFYYQPSSVQLRDLSNLSVMLDFSLSYTIHIMFVISLLILPSVFFQICPYSAFHIQC